MSRWIEFKDAGTSASGKTRVWKVVAKGGGVLGSIVWYSSWRCYVFGASECAVFEQDCLRDIARFIESQTREHKAAWKAAKS